MSFILNPLKIYSNSVMLWIEQKDTYTAKEFCIQRIRINLKWASRGKSQSRSNSYVLEGPVKTLFFFSNHSDWLLRKLAQICFFFKSLSYPNKYHNVHN